MKKLLDLIFVIVGIVLAVSSERIKDKIYENVIGASCFRRLNGTHQAGCSSKHSGSSGVIHIISSKMDLDFILENPRSPPYIAVVPPHLFTRENILRLRDEGGKNISGIVLINKIEQMKYFSSELKCPNQYSSIKEQTCDESRPDSIWNPFGSGLLLENFKFPIYYVSDNNTINKIIDCFEKFNNFDKENQAGRSLCSLEISTSMAATGNSKICLNRSKPSFMLYPSKFCEPIEGNSIFGTLFPREPLAVLNTNDIDPKEKFILISSRIDTASMFEGIGLGAADSLVSFATLLNIAHVLAKILPEKKLSPNRKNYNVIFVFFNGESFDYIGSQRFVYDLNKFSFPRNSHRRPISFEQIKFMIDLGSLDDLNNITLITAKQFPQSNTFHNYLKEYNNHFNFNIEFNIKETLDLPPTSAQTFLRQNLSFPVVVLTSKPQNRFYHSIYDDAYNIDYTYSNKSKILDFSELIDQARANFLFKPNSIQMKIGNISSNIAFALYEMLTDSEYHESKIANPVLVDEFLLCFLETADCPLFKAASHPNSPPGLPIPPSRYISVFRTFQEAAVMTYRLLGYLISEKVNIKKENCTILPLHWFAAYNNTGECRLTTQNNTIAISPAFSDPDNYDWNSGKYSTWTESTWTPFSARIYIRPSRVQETLVLTIGIVVLILSFVIIYLIDSRSEILFESIPVSSSSMEPAAC